MSIAEYSFRFLWFILIGWWAALVWLSVALLTCLTVVGIPVGYAMMNYLKGIAFAPQF